MRQLFVAGNWKMNTTASSAGELAQELAAAVPAEQNGVEVLVCPPCVYLERVGTALQGSGVQLGAQNAYFEGPGAFTGEVAVEMLLDVGCRYVILGHSERRHVLGEDDALINNKVRAALARELKVVLCVGELLEQRTARQTESVLETQMQDALQGVDAASFGNVVIAYEPVWAIGTGVTATPDEAESTQAYLRKWLCSRYNANVGEATRIVYGGSVKPDNARDLLGQANVDGALVGGASLSCEMFLPIVQVAVEIAGR